MVSLEGAVRGFFCGCEGDWALRGEASGDLQRLLHELLGLEQTVHQPPLVRLVGVDQPAREDQLLGETEPADARESLRPTPPRNDSQVDLGLPKLRAGRRVA